MAFVRRDTSGSDASDGRARRPLVYSKLWQDPEVTCQVDPAPPDPMHPDFDERRREALFQSNDCMIGRART